MVPPNEPKVDRITEVYLD